MIPRAVLFDAGNTLIFLDYGRLAARVGEALALPLSEAALRAAAPAAARAMEQGALTDRERGRRFLLALFAGAGVPAEREEELAAVLLALHHERHLWGSVEAGTAEALERLRAAGLRLAVVSNSDGRAAAALAAAGLDGHFEFVVDSGEVGIEKPDARIFHHALDRLGVGAGEALYVGDLYEVDVVGARAAGMRAVLVDPAGGAGVRDVPVIRAVRELPDLLLAGRAA